MTLFETIKATKQPTVLYHYTSLSGLMGIAASGNLWATKIQFLNDSSEMKYGVDAARHELTKYADAIGDDKNIRNVLLAAADGLERISKVNLCVACFCTERNLLSQWRAYSRETVGYSIGFRTHQLIRAAVRQQFYLAPCVYDHVQQKRLLREAIEMTVSDFERGLATKRTNPVFNEAAYIEKFASHFLAAILERLPLIKNPLFAEEREWRLVSPLISSLDERFGVHAARSCLVPHFDFSLREEDGKIHLDEVIIGPNQYGWDALDGLDLLLRRNKVDWARLSVSNIPYRQL